MKTKEAREIVIKIFDELTNNSEMIPKNFIIEFMNHIVEECGACQSEGILFQDEEIKDCLKNISESVEAYKNTTKNIKNITEENIPEITTLISSTEEEKVKEASKKLKIMQDDIQSELKRADDAIINFNKRIKRLQILSRIDKLTKLYNKKAYIGDITPILKIGQNKNLDLCLLLFEIENLKLIKQNHGEEAYKKILIYFSKLLTSMVRKENKIYRYSENKFLILLNRSTKEKMYDTARRITAKLQKQRIVYNEKDVEVKICVGKSIHEINDSVENFTGRVFGKKQCFVI